MQEGPSLQLLNLLYICKLILSVLRLRIEPIEPKPDFPSRANTQSYPHKRPCSWRARSPHFILSKQSTLRDCRTWYLSMEIIYVRAWHLALGQRFKLPTNNQTASSCIPSSYPRVDLPRCRLKQQGPTRIQVKYQGKVWGVNMRLCFSRGCPR